MIWVILLLWTSVSCIVSFVYILRNVVLFEGNWDRTVSVLEVILLLLCLPVVVMTACLYGVVWSICTLYEKSGLGKILNRKFKVGR